MKSAQQTLEFFLVYGWALLIIFMLVLAIAYFDVFNFSTILPGVCDFTSDFECYSAKASSTTQIIDLELKNSVGAKIIINDIMEQNMKNGCYGESNFTIDDNPPPQSISTNDVFKLRIYCKEGLVSKTRYSSDLLIDYSRYDNNINYTAQGRIRQKIS